VRCEADCDSDADCAAGLLCHFAVPGTPVPGCTLAAASNATLDYCYDPHWEQVENDGGNSDFEICGSVDCCWEAPGWCDKLSSCLDSPPCCDAGKSSHALLPLTRFDKLGVSLGVAGHGGACGYARFHASGGHLFFVLFFTGINVSSLALHVVAAARAYDSPPPRPLSC
jgi:hypothetical protein